MRPTAGGKIMFGIWNDPEAKDEDIKSCWGDYVGCEVCIHKEKCFSFLKEKLEKSLKDGGKQL